MHYSISPIHYSHFNCTCYSGLTQSEQGARTGRIAYERTTLSPNLCSSKETCKNKQDTMERKRTLDKRTRRTNIEQTDVINKQPSELRKNIDRSLYIYWAS